MNITDELLHHKGKALAYFRSDAFPLCVNQTKEFRIFASSQSETKCVEIVSDKSPDLSMLYAIMSAPTLVLFENGKEIKRTSRVLSAEEITEFIK